MNSPAGVLSRLPLDIRQQIYDHMCRIDCPPLRVRDRRPQHHPRPCEHPRATPAGPCPPRRPRLRRDAPLRPRRRHDAHCLDLLRLCPNPLRDWNYAPDLFRRRAAGRHGCLSLPIRHGDVQGARGGSRRAIWLWRGRMGQFRSIQARGMGPDQAASSFRLRVPRVPSPLRLARGPAHPL